MNGKKVNHARYFIILMDFLEKNENVEYMGIDMMTMMLTNVYIFYLPKAHWT